MCNEEQGKVELLPQPWGREVPPAGAELWKIPLYLGHFSENRICDKRRMSSWRCWCCLSCFTTLTLSLLCLQECMPGPAVPWGAAVVPEGFCCRFWMMSEQDLADVVQIAVEDLTPDNPGRKRFPAVPMDWRSLLSFSLKYKPGVYSKSCFWIPCPMISRASLVYLPNPLDQIILFISLFS